MTIYYFKEPVVHKESDNSTFYYCNSRAMHYTSEEELIKDTLFNFDDIRKKDLPEIVSEEVAPYDYYVVLDKNDTILLAAKTDVEAKQRALEWLGKCNWSIEGRYWD